MNEPHDQHPRTRGGSARGRQVSASRVRDLITASIREGYLHPDQPLAEEDLMRLFEASRGSVRTALTQLRDSGFVERKRRVGTRITGMSLQLPLADIDATAHYPDAPQPGAGQITIQCTEDREVPAFPLVLERLAIDATTVRMVENLFTIDDEVIGVRTAYFSVEYTFDPRDVRGPLTMKELIERYFDRDTGEIRVRIGAEQADAHTARILGTHEGLPLITREMTYYTRAGVPIEIVFDRYRSDRVQLNATAGAD